LTNSILPAASLGLGIMWEGLGIGHKLKGVIADGNLDVTENLSLKIQSWMEDAEFDVE
jgi:hypothetical protein